MNPVSLAQSFLADVAAGVVPEEEMRKRARVLFHDLEPYRTPLAPMGAEEREGIEALRGADFRGLGRDVLIATIHDLARRLLGEE